MGTRTSQQRQSYQVQIGLDAEQQDSELRNACTICDDLHSIRSTVGLLLDLCKANRKIDPVNLSGVLTMLGEKLDGTEDSANGLRRLIECLAPTPDLQQGAEENDHAGLPLVPPASTCDS